MHLIIAFIEEAVEYLEMQSLEPSERNLKSYDGWMKYQQVRLRNGETMLTLDKVKNHLKSPKERARFI